MFSLYILFVSLYSFCFIEKKRHLSDSASLHFEINNIITYRKTIFDGPTPHSFLEMKVPLASNTYISPLV